MSESKRIVKNTMFLYIRMFLLMGVTLYTSRIVLRELGVSDYGIYSVVGGFVTLLGVLSGAMSSATQRYLSFSIGKGDFVQLKKTFSITLTIHIGIAVLGLLLAETLGLWYVNYKMVFPDDRVFAVNMVYQFSILTFLLKIIQVPYNALIIARERMNMYAYVSILEAVLRLAIVFMLVYFGSDKLITYAILTFSIAFIIRMIYQIYCHREFAESRYKFQYDKKYYKELISYSGWNFLGNIAFFGKNQGINIVLNLFFGTVVNAAYGVTNQVYGAVNLFVSNFQLALNPQIIQNYSQGNLKQVHYLISQGSKFSFFLMLIIVTPILLNTDYILHLWLNNPPEYTVDFLQLCLVNILIECLSGTLLTGAQATGKMKRYQLIVGSLVFLNLPLSYLMLKLGFEPYSTYVIAIIISLLSLQFRLFFLKREMEFDVREYYFRVLSKVAVLGSFVAAIIFGLQNYWDYELNIWTFIVESIFVMGLLVLMIIIVGITKNERKLILQLINKKFKRHK
ncbi:oligosaccharide flippase family protein [Avrilella dinanensis]|uniref:Polysaccharide biosynthesis protein n=1 Tax=Avrilella dinanensis TaxID=2008672 RepID=A0A2M9R4S8_9FLAO|nr:oligosaccharide flippase family protein [Avrilella dinanensis]PJR03868.1 hypothetical protein CDL10_04515 [Avrilella dinanensis]